MVTGVYSERTHTATHVRPMDPRRDGRAVAALLELCFHADGIDDGGQRLLNMLRHYGPFETWTLDGAPGFVWVDERGIVGNASVQRNIARRDTWIVGNVATHPDHRGRGIATQLVEACVRHAIARGARFVALQVHHDNPPALRVYQKLGFKVLGNAIHYRHGPMSHHQPLVIAAHDATADFSIRNIHWRDRFSVWDLVQQNVPPDMTYAEPFDPKLYQLGLRWRFTNTMNGNPEHWRVGEDNFGHLGAVRTRANQDQSEHHLELLLDDGASPQMGAALVYAGLDRLRQYISRPVLAVQARTTPQTHEALQMCGFQPNRELVHMRLSA